MNTSVTLIPDQASALKRVLITGANGQVGWELQRAAPKGIEIIALNRNFLDIRDQNQVEKVVTELAPDIVINAAAYTAVDRAEQEPKHAFAVNAKGAGYLAEATHSQGARFIHISTDFVFDGAKSRPYLPDDLPSPLGVYGASKLAGEQLVREHTQNQAVIIRTSWVYSVHGHNFVKTMLRLMRERKELNVVADQVGTPTWALNLANTIWTICENTEYKGIYHCTDAGVASWYDFATAIRDYAVELGQIDRSITIHPISTREYPTLAPRPPFSVLNSAKCQIEIRKRSCHWRHSLRRMMIELLERNGSVLCTDNRIQ